MPKAKKRAGKKSRKVAKRTRSKSVKKAKKSSPRCINERMLFAISSILILSAVILSVPSQDMESIFEEQEQQADQISEIKVLYSCESNLECFLVGCKSSGTPSFMECVNTMTQETYYDNCEGYWDVRVIQDFARCACVQGLCELVE
ncbi:MAG: hypothetical protein JW700_03335 [Candidatus Aenigmarchaeota archaeon]|nr:hypothetical protein [Candidatus Aenigmarchaeota archaeon]